MGIASIVHLYVFPSKPYEIIDDRFLGDVSVLGDYASVNCQVDPDEVRDSERPTKLRLPHPENQIRSGTTIRESVRDVVLGGGGYVSSILTLATLHVCLVYGNFSVHIYLSESTETYPGPSSLNFEKN
jgi:hypothetical protein